MRQKIRGPRKAGHGRVCVHPRGRSGTWNFNTHAGGFRREWLPDAAASYAREFDVQPRGTWATVRCVFHEDGRPSLSLNFATSGRHLFDIGEWAIYETDVTPEWRGIKFVLAAGQARKANFWLGWDGGRFARTAEYGLLRKQMPTVADELRARLEGGA